MLRNVYYNMADDDDIIVFFIMLCMGKAASLSLFLSPSLFFYPCAMLLIITWHSRHSTQHDVIMCFFSNLS